jgi:hypothetical protein
MNLRDFLEPSRTARVAILESDEMIQTKTIALVVLIAIATVGAIGIGIETQSAQGQEVNPSTGNPHPAGEPTGNPHQAPNCSGNPHGQSAGRGGFGSGCPGSQ